MTGVSTHSGCYALRHGCILAKGGVQENVIRTRNPRPGRAEPVRRVAQGTVCLDSFTEPNMFSRTIPCEGPGSAVSATDTGPPEYAMHIYRQIPDLVVALVSDDDKYNSPAKPYLRSEKNPDGLPAWKVSKEG